MCGRRTLPWTGDTVGKGRWWGLATWQWRRGSASAMLRTFFGDLMQRNCVPSPVVGQVRVGGRVLLLHDENWEEARLAGLALRLLRTAHCVFVNGCHVYWRWTSHIRLCVSELGEREGGERAPSLPSSRTTSTAAADCSRVTSPHAHADWKRGTGLSAPQCTHD